MPLRKPKLRAPRKPKRLARKLSRAYRYTNSPQPPDGPILRYRMLMRQLVAAWWAKAGPQALAKAKRIGKPDETRSDAEESDEAEESVDASLSDYSSTADVGWFDKRIGGVADAVEKHSDTQFKRLGIKLSKSAPGVSKLAPGFRKENVGLVKTMFQSEQTKLEKLLSDGAGRRVESLSRDIADRFDITTRHAEMIARDQCLKLNANISHTRMVNAGITQFTWSTSGDERVRPMHDELDGETFDFDDPPVTNDDGDTNLPGEDYQCLPGDTKIALTSRIRRAYRRRYNGKLTELVADSGVTLKCTPNHPILTSAGWKAAEAVEVGDYVFDVRHQRLQFSEVNVEKREASISDLFGTLALLWFSERRLGTASQFHGDGADEQIDIVNVERELLFHDKPASAENFRKFLFAVPNTEAPAGSAFEQSLSALGLTSNGDMRRFCYCLTLLDGRVRKSNPIGFASAAQCQAASLQEISDCLALDPVALSERFHRGALSIQAEAFLLREWFCVWCNSVMPECRDSASAEMLRQIISGDFEGLGDLAKQSPVFEHPLRVVEKRVSELPFNGHVYNLETDDGWYAASIAVHNCRCVAFPIVPELESDSSDDSEEEPDDE